MRERAARLGGTLHVDSVPGGGTSVSLEISAGGAYAAPQSRWRGPRAVGA